MADRLTRESFNLLGGSPDLRNPTLSDTVDEIQISRGIHIGDDTLAISFVTEWGTIVNFAAGEIAKGLCHPYHVRRVRSSGTSMPASKIWLVY